jgi:hypothetical protein
MDKRLILTFAIIGAAGILKIPALIKRQRLFIDSEKNKNSDVHKDTYSDLHDLSFSITPVQIRKNIKCFDLEIKNDTSYNVDIVWPKTYFLENGQTAGAFYTNLTNKKSTESRRPDIVFAKSKFVTRLYPFDYSYEKVVPPIPGTGMATSQVVSWQESLKEGEYGIYLTYKYKDEEHSKMLTFAIGYDKDKTLWELIKESKAYLS